MASDRADTVIAEVMTIEGAFASALVDFESGVTLATRTTTLMFDIEAAAVSSIEVLRAEMRTVQSLGVAGGVGEILISLRTECYLLRPLRRHDGVFLYLVIDRGRGNLAMARSQLASIETSLRSVDFARSEAGGGR